MVNKRNFSRFFTKILSGQFFNIPRSIQSPLGHFPSKRLMIFKLFI